MANSPAAFMLQLRIRMRLMAYWRIAAATSTIHNTNILTMVTTKVISAEELCTVSQFEQKESHNVKAYLWKVLKPWHFLSKIFVWGPLHVCMLGNVMCSMYHM